MIQLHLEMSETEIDHLQKLAHEYGYDTPEAYLKQVALNLIHEPTKAEILDDIREGILAIQRGDPMITVEEMWEEINSGGHTHLRASPPLHICLF
ncbi:MAG: hypothetical protein MUE54_04065 [Anaerolineae bacterium]|nr:hypothetical protein [Anaerolineae bacterium]